MNNDAFAQLHAALNDLWQKIKGPFEWIAARPLLLFVYALVCLMAIIIDLLLR